MRRTLATVASAGRAGELSLAEVIEIALANSPLTRTSFAQSRAAAAAYGSARGRYVPSLSADLIGGPSQAISANPARLPANRTTITPTLSLQYLLFDFGARRGTSLAAREALFAADLSHNSLVQSVVLETEQAYFAYQSARGLLEAARATVRTAEQNLSGADHRHEVGLATIADVLQARTALAQAQLAAQTAEGNVQAARATLALAMGLEANRPFDVAADTSSSRLGELAESVDSLIARAVRQRPDVAAARALARQGDAEIRVARSAAFPSLSVGSTTGRSFSNVPALEGRTYAFTFGLQIPIFSGLSRQYDVVVAQELANAAGARADQARLQAIAQVFTSYYALQTAAKRVATAAELLTSATQSEEVARGRYAEGVGSILDVLTAQSALADARAQAVQSRWTWYSSLAQLARDAGVLGPRGETGLRLIPDSSGTPRR